MNRPFIAIIAALALVLAGAPPPAAALDPSTVPSGGNCPTGMTGTGGACVVCLEKGAFLALLLSVSPIYVSVCWLHWFTIPGVYDVSFWQPIGPVNTGDYYVDPPPSRLTWTRLLWAILLDDPHPY